MRAVCHHAQALVVIKVGACENHPRRRWARRALLDHRSTAGSAASGLAQKGLALAVRYHSASGCAPRQTIVLRRDDRHFARVDEHTARNDLWLERDEQRLVEAFVAQAAVEALDLAVLLRLAWRDVVPLDRALLRPPQDRQAGQFGAVVADDHQRRDAPERDDGVEFASDARA